MSNIRIDLDTTIFDGQDLVFKSPCDCSDVTGLIIYYPDAGSVITSQEFKFTDAHGNDVGNIDALFAEDVLVKIVLDTTTHKAFVQNADTNAYLEGKFKNLEVDYIVEQGYTNDGWTYRKWNSGIVECWKNTYNINISWGGNGPLYYSDERSKLSLSFPRGLFVEIPCVYLEFAAFQGMYISAHLMSLTLSSCEVTFSRTYGGNDIAKGTLHSKLIGRWQ